MTLPELMVSVTILGVLASAAVTSYTERVAVSRSVEAIATLGEMQKATDMVAADDDANHAVQFQVQTFGSTKAFGNGNGNSGNGNDSKTADVEENSADVELSNSQSNNGHGNNEGDCDPSNPSGKGCDGESTESEDSSDNGNSDKVNKDADLDNDGNNGHGNNDGKCDPSNPGNSKNCDSESDSGGDDGGEDTSDDSGGDDSSGSDTGSDTGSDDNGGDSAGGGSWSTNYTQSNTLCDSASPVPSSIKSVRGAVYQSGASDWNSGSSSGGWKCLAMDRTGPQRYQYGYDRGAGNVENSSGSYTAWARGDLDGDGRTSLFRMRGEMIDGTLVHATSIESVDPTE